MSFIFVVIVPFSVDSDATKFHYLDQLAKAITIGQEFDVHRIRFHLANGQYFYRCGVKILERLVLSTVSTVSNVLSKLLFFLYITNTGRITEVRSGWLNMLVMNTS